MEREYSVLENGYIQYSENEFNYIIPTDPSNSDYQAYLASLEETEGK